MQKNTMIDRVSYRSIEVRIGNFESTWQEYYGGGVWEKNWRRLELNMT